MGVGAGAGPEKKPGLKKWISNYFSWKWSKKCIIIPEGAPIAGGAPVDDADVIGGGGGSGIDVVVVLDEVVEVEFVDLDEDRLVAL